MSKFMNLVRLGQRGFTLVELMVVVAIIGILSAIAIPNFKKYQAKSKTAEAKLQLAAAYTAEQSFFSDYDTYSYCLKYMGYNPINEASQRYYAIGFGSDLTTCTSCDGVATLNGAVTGAGACAGGAGESFFGAGKRLGSIAALTTFAAADVSTASVSPTSFVLGAVGIIDDSATTSGTASAFSINQSKQIRQIRAGY